MNTENGLVAHAAEKLATIAPKALTVLGALVAGLLLSALSRRAVGWLVRRSGLEALLERAGVAKLLYKVGWKDGATPIIQAFVWYVGVLATVTTVAEMLGLTGLTAGLSAIIAFLPRLLSAALLAVGGLWLAGLVRGLVNRLSQRTSTEGAPASAAGQVCYGLVLALTVMVVLDQLGVQVGLLSSLMQITAAATAFAVALAFGLGGRTVFENLLARHYYAALVRPGDRVRVGEVEGTVARVTPVAVVIVSAQGEQVVPCSTLLTGVTELRRLGHEQVSESDPR